MRQFFRFSTFTILYSLLGCVYVFAENGVSPKPYSLWNLEDFQLPVTNSMVTSWVFSIALILIVRLIVGKRPAMVPGFGQAILEKGVEGLRETLEPIVGKRMITPTFPLLMSFFVFILIQNWSGLIPGVGAFGHYDEHGHFLYYFRPGNADLNMTLALSIISFLAWIYYVVRYAGIKALVYDLFGNKADKNDVPGTMYYFLFLIFFGVGIIEVISVMLRLVSLSFRLFGNVFGGENLLASVQGMMSYLLPVPFYFLEILIGLIQAFVFTLLTAIYIGLICNHGDHGDEEHAH